MTSADMGLEYVTYITSVDNGLKYLSVVGKLFFILILRGHTDALNKMIKLEFEPFSDVDLNTKGARKLIGVNLLICRFFKVDFVFPQKDKIRWKIDKLRKIEENCHIIFTLFWYI